jgi:hypothetical protein
VGHNKIVGTRLLLAQEESHSPYSKAMEDTVGELGPHLEVKTICMWELLRNNGAPNPCNGAYSPKLVEVVFSEVAASVECLSALEFARGTLEGIMDQ